MNQRKAILIPVLCSIVLLLTACPAGTPYRQALVLARDAAVTLRSAQQAITIAHDEGFVSSADYQSAQMTIRRIAEADQKIVDAVEKFKDRQTALDQIDKSLAVVDDFLQNGLLGIKNENRRVAIQAIILSLRGTLVTAKALLQAAK